jgi:hypothetical protein
MAYPAGVTTRTLTFGSAVELETGDSIEMRVVIKASRSMVWEGTPVVSIGAQFISKGGAEASVDLPVTDQSGWTDGVGGAISVSGGAQTHTYSATVEYWVGNKAQYKITVGPFALPTDDLSPVDMDNLIPASGSSGVVVSVPDVWTLQIADLQDQIDAIVSGGGGGGGGGIDIHSSTGKSIPVDADELVLADSAASWATKKFTLANLKSVLDSAGIAKLKTARTISGVSFDGTANITLTKSNVGLDQVDNTSDADKLASTDVQFQLDGKAASDHTHDSRYPRLDQTSSILFWKTGDADPWWVAGNNRPANLTMFLVIGAEDTVPSWKIARDIIFVVDAVINSAPTIRSFGSFTAMTSDSSSTSCVIPADCEDGDTLWLPIVTNGTTPTTPSGWSVAKAFLNSGASNSNGLILYARTLGSGDAASLAGTTVTVTLGTTTSALGTVICWNGAVALDTSTTGVDDANSSTAQTFPAITPGVTPTTVVGIGGIRYNTLSGGQNIGTRTGWTEVIDRATAKAGAPQRGLVVSTYDTDGESGTAISAATGNSPGPDLRTSNFTLSVVPA